jgi:hypothetical protein
LSNGSIIFCLSRLNNISLNNLPCRPVLLVGAPQWRTNLTFCATAELECIEHPTPLVSFFPTSLVSLTVQDRTLTYHIPSQLRQLHPALAQCPYLMKHHHWATDVFNTVNWDLLWSCLPAYSTTLRFFFVKWINHLMPLQAQQHKFKQSPSLACPSRWGASVEDKSHFLCCSHLDHLAIFTKLQTQHWPSSSPNATSTRTSAGLSGLLWTNILIP